MGGELTKENADKELVDVLLDFIIVAANLAKKVIQCSRDRKAEGGKADVKDERTCTNHIGTEGNVEDDI